MLVGRKLCQAASCRSTRNADAGETPGRPGDGRSLCITCRDRLVNDLLHLPALYSDCNRNTGPEVVRVIRRLPRKSAAAESMSPAAAEVRSAIRTVLASWAGLVAEERHLEPPARDIPALARFLCQHVKWLARHPAAGELVDEIRELTRNARSIAYPNSVRRVTLGCCPDCEGELVALIRPRDDFLPSEIVCTTSPSHTWPVTCWTTLARQIRGSQAQGSKEKVLEP